MNRPYLNVFFTLAVPLENLFVRGGDYANVSINYRMSHLKFLLLSALLAVSCGLYAQTISVNLDQSYQTIDFWENGGYLPPAIVPYVIDDVVNLSVDTLGINRLRLEIRCGTEHSADNYQAYQDSTIDYDTWRSQRYATVNDNNDPFTIDWAGFHFTEFDEKIEDIIVPFRNRLLQNGAELYINLCFVAFTGQINDGAGGSIIHQDPEEYAEFIQAVFLHMQSEYGFVPDGVEVILEPNVASFGDATLVGECLVAAGDRLSNIGYHPDFIACSNTNLNGAINYYPAFSAVPGVANYWKEYSFHAYAGRNDANLLQIATNAAASGVKTSMLEWWANGNTYSYLHDCLSLANVSSYEFKGSFGAPGNNWNSGLLQIVDNGDNNFSLALQRPTKYFRHYFKLIHPGAIRYEATSSDADYDALAFVNPDGNLLLNIDAATSGVAQISGLPAGTYQTIYSLGDGRTEPNPYWEKSAIDTIALGEQMSIEMAGQGIYSIVQLSGVVPTSLSEETEAAVPYAFQITKGMLSVSAISSNSIEDISIYSSSGQKVYSGSYQAAQMAQVNSSLLSAGVYIVIVNHQFAKKLFLY